MDQREGGIPGWVRDTTRIRRASIPVGHTVRAALCVGGPAVLGFALDEVVTGVTVSLACVLRTIGERRAPYRANVRSLLIATPIAGLGYLFGSAQDLPLPALIALMAAVAFVAGTLEVHGGAFALGGMQLLLVTSVAIGVPDTGVVETITLFLGGAALYLACMVVDGRFLEPEPVPPAAPDPPPADRGRPWRERLAVDAATCRQAGRLALCFAIAVSARAWVELDHWFWIPATVGLVMQPSFGSVPGRAVQRAAGTVLGALVAALVLTAVPDGVGLGLAMGVLAAAIPWAKLASYTLQSAALAAVVVLLVDQLDPSSVVSLPFQRVVATVIGGAIVLVFGYLIWPEARRLEAAASTLPG